MASCPGCGFELATSTSACERCGASPPHARKSAEAGSGALRHLTVLFCDLAGSSKIAERLDPEAYFEFVRSYQSICSGAIGAFDGYVAQYLGDGVLAYFGYPTAHEDDPRRAILAALKILAGVEERAASAPRSEPPMVVRIGIHTGTVVTGEIGVGTARESLALGHTPNVAARLQGVAEPGTVVISAAVLRLASGYFHYRSLGVRKLQGMADEVEVFAVEGERSHSRFEALSARGLTPFVGRDTELRALHAAWERASRGEHASVLIRGEAGMGKSRLTRCAIEHVEAGASGVTVLESSPFHSNTVLFPVVDLLKRQWLRRPAGAATRPVIDALAALADQSGLDRRRAVPLLAALLDLPPDPDYPLPVMGPELQREETLRVLLRVMLAVPRPHLLVFEDLQWADATSLELLSRLIQDGPAGLLLVANCRPEFELPWASSGETSVLTLERLTDAELRSLIARVDSAHELPGALVEPIARVTDGIPLFVEELTKSMLESAAASKARGGVAPFELQPLHPVPETLQDSLVARLDRLGDAKDIAQRAAVIGRRFDHALLLRVSDVDERALQEGLDRLTAAGLLFSVGPAPAAVYQFKHALIQLAAYNSLLRSVRADLHRRIVRALEQHFAEVWTTDPELVAHHCELGQLPGPAIASWMRAGQRAFERSANIEASAHFKRARALLSEMPPAQALELELQILARLGPALIATTGFASPEVGEVYGRALAVCQMLPNKPATFPALWGSWVFFLVKGELTTSLGFAQDMLGLAEQTGDSSLMIEARWTTGNSYYWLGRLREADQQLAAAEAVYTPEGHARHAFLFGQDPGVAAHCYHSFVYWMLGRPADSEAAILSAERIARALNHPFTTAWPMAFRILLASHRGDAATGLEWADRLIQFSEEQKQQYWLQAAIIIRGWARARLGNPEAGIEEMRRGMAAYSGTGAGVSLPHFQGLLCEALLDSGRLSEAEVALAAAFESARRNGERLGEIELWRIQARLLQAGTGGAPERVIECYRTAISIAQECEAWAPGLRAAAGLHRFLVEHRMNIGSPSPLPALLRRFPDEVDFPELAQARALLGPTTHKERTT
jgi:class 3 adenylate cyclase/predicted ATPase